MKPDTTTRHNYTDDELLEASNKAFDKHCFGREWSRAFLAALPTRSAEPERPQAQPGPWPGQQEAIDKAFEEVRAAHLVTPKTGDDYAPARLAIAQAYDKSRPQAAETIELKRELDELNKDMAALLRFLDANDAAEGVEKARYWKQSIKRLTDERDKAQGILKDCLAVMPFGNIETHTVENLPGRIADLASEIAAVSSENERLESELAAIRQPILADDGRTLGQVAFEAAEYSHKWAASNKFRWQAVAKAVVAAARPAIEAECLAQAVRRMEAVPKEEIWKVYKDDPHPFAQEALESVRARLISAFKGEGQAMVKNIPGDKCPVCGAEEVESNTPSTTYACGSSNYDGRPGTFHPGDKCEAPLVVVNEVPQGEKQPDLSGESEKQTEPAQAKLTGTQPVNIDEAWMQARPWTPAVGDTVRPTPEKALGGQMYWRDLAIQLARVWWKCHGIGASLQHGDLDKDIAFSVVCERHGGKVFHADSPENAWHKAEEWLLSPDRENFPAACLTPVPNP